MRAALVRLYREEKSYEVDFREERGGVNEHPLDEESTQEK